MHSNISECVKPLSLLALSQLGLCLSISYTHLSPLSSSLILVSFSFLISLGFILDSI